MGLAKRLAWLKEMGHSIKQAKPDLQVLYTYLGTLAPIDGMIEIGCFHGGSLYVFADHVVKGSPIVALEAFVDEDASIRKRKTMKVIKELCAEGHKVELALGDSRKIVDKVVAILGDRKVGLLHIDGGHEYATVRADFNNYTPFVAKGGAVILHDIVNFDVGVPRLWAELKKRYGDRAIEQDDIVGRGSGVILL